MKTEDLYSDLLNRFKTLSVVEEKDKVEETARQLHEMNYEPPFLIPVKNFPEFTRKDALKYLNDILETPDNTLKKLPVASTHSPDEIRQKTMEMLAREFDLLQKLRLNDPEAWDHINELYEDD